MHNESRLTPSWLSPLICTSVMTDLIHFKPTFHFHTTWSFQGAKKWHKNGRFAWNRLKTFRRNYFSIIHFSTIMFSTYFLSNLSWKEQPMVHVLLFYFSSLLWTTGYNSRKNTWQKVKKNKTKLGRKRKFWYLHLL